MSKTNCWRQMCEQMELRYGGWDDLERKGFGNVLLTNRQRTILRYLRQRRGRTA